MFSRIVDVENFSEVVLSAVRGEEKRELEHRLGILNVLNPVRVKKSLLRVQNRSLQYLQGFVSACLFSSRRFPWLS